MPFVLLIRQPQAVFLALKSPARMMGVFEASRSGISFKLLTVGSE